MKRRHRIVGMDAMIAYASAARVVDRFKGAIGTSCRRGIAEQ